MADLRDLLGSSRKYTIAIAGWLDAIGITRRQGDLRVRGAATLPAGGLDGAGDGGGDGGDDGLGGSPLS